MKQEEIKILIVEDNTTFGESIKEALVQSGYTNTFLALTPDEAMYYNKIHFIHCFIIDCLLPQMQGLELALNLKGKEESDSHHKRHFFFMSGIFQKADVFDEIKQKIDTQTFFSKPFSPDTLISQIDQCFAKYRKAKTSLVELIFTQKELSIKERLSILSNIKQINGFTLPQVIKLLDFPKISGALNLSTDNNKQHVYLSEGKITFIELNQKELKDLFGDLLIKKNLLSFEELQPFFDVEEDGKKIGERLVDANLISPHIIQMLTREQVGIRFMHLIQNTYYNIDFQQTSHIPPDKKTTAINQKELMNIYAKYLKVKIPIKYLKNIYLNRLNDQIHVKPNFILSDFFTSTFEKTVEILMSIRDENHSLLSLLNKHPNHINEVYFIVHLFLLSKQGYLQITKDGETTQVKALRLKKVLSNLKSQNYFEVLNISEQANISEIKQAYKELSVTFYPNSVNSLGSTEIKNLLTNIFHEIKTAYEVLSDAKKRKDYELSIEYKNLTAVLESKQLFLEAKKALDVNNKKTALELFRKLMKVDTSPAPHVLLYFIWSQITNFSTQNSSEQITEINSCFDKIPPEYRNTTLFYFVKGLFYKILNNKEMAISHLKYAYHLDPNFVKAKQEMRALSYHKKSINILKGDLKDVIKAIPFFKKKAG